MYTYIYLESILVIPDQFANSLTNYEMEQGLMVFGLFILCYVLVFAIFCISMFILVCLGWWAFQLGQD